jgi:prolipoprotein diacylglyceryltransferase
MHLTLTILMCIFWLIGIIAGALGFIFALILSGYFFARILLKIMRLHSGSPAQIRGELKGCLISAVLILFSIACFFIFYGIGFYLGVPD